MIDATADVAVIGGGPGGVAAALTLARAGRDVVLVDKATFPRDKCCGDGVTTGAWRRYEALGLPPDAVASWQPVADAVLCSPAGRAHKLPVPRTAIARRSDLDAAFVDVARAAGVKVHDGHALTGARVASDGVTVDVEGVGSMAAPYVVAADGMWSTVRKALEVNPSPASYLGHWHAFRQYFHHVGPDARERMWVWFEPDVLPGYAWSFPLPDGRANVGFGIRRGVEPTGAMKDLWPDLLGRAHIAAVLGPDAAPEAPHKAWPIPCGSDTGVLAAAGGRVLFAGDAARLADPMTGEGIGQALESGVEAARAILRAGPTDPGGAARRYAAAIERGLALDNRLAAVLSGVLASPVWAERVLRLAGLTTWTRRNFSRWLLEAYPRAVVGTPWRWASDHV